MQCAEMRPNKDKQYVDVLAHHRLDGQTIPIRFKAEDLPAQRIVKVLDIRPGYSMKAGGQGLRYTCVLEDGSTIYLFHDRNLWFYPK